MDGMQRIKCGLLEEGCIIMEGRTITIEMWFILPNRMRNSQLRFDVKRSVTTHTGTQTIVLSHCCIIAGTATNTISWHVSVCLFVIVSTVACFQFTRVGTYRWGPNKGLIKDVP